VAIPYPIRASITERSATLTGNYQSGGSKSVWELDIRLPDYETCARVRVYRL